MHGVGASGQPVRAKVKHPFWVIKRQFGYVKTRNRDLKKNAAQIATLIALSNFVDGAPGFAGGAGMSAPEMRQKSPGEVSSAH